MSPYILEIHTPDDEPHQYELEIPPIVPRVGEYIHPNGFNLEGKGRLRVIEVQHIVFDPADHGRLTQSVQVKTELEPWPVD